MHMQKLLQGACYVHYHASAVHVATVPPSGRLQAALRVSSPRVKARCGTGGRDPFESGGPPQFMS